MEKIQTILIPHKALVRRHCDGTRKFREPNMFSQSYSVLRFIPLFLIPPATRPPSGGNVTWLFMLLLGQTSYRNALLEPLGRRDLIAHTSVKHSIAKKMKKNFLHCLLNCHSPKELKTSSFHPFISFTDIDLENSSLKTWLTCSNRIYTNTTMQVFAAWWRQVFTSLTPSPMTKNCLTLNFPLFMGMGDY